MTQGDLSEAIYGDRKHLPNIYSSLMSLVNNGQIIRTGDHPAYYSLGDAIITTAPSKRKNIVMSRMRNIAPDIPRPTISEVNFWLNEWKKLPDYTIQEDAINELFNGHYKNNDNLKNILIKCSVLNDFYSTNIYKIYPVAVHILNLNIDQSLSSGDPSIVNKIAKVTFTDKTKNLYSFATKYCSHHNQTEYPIYDSYVDKVLRYFKRIDGFCLFENYELKNYIKFKNILLSFRSFYNLEKFTLKEFDRFLWQFGKKYFPKKY